MSVASREVRILPGPALPSAIVFTSDGHVVVEGKQPVLWFYRDDLPHGTALRRWLDQATELTVGQTE